MTADFISHLEELRKRIFICLIFFVLAWIACYCFSRPLVEALIAPLKRYEDAQLVFQTPYEAFMTHLHVSGLAAFLLSSPVIFGQLWGFLVPALYTEEKRIIFPLVGFSAILFAAGFSFAYFLVVPMGLHFFLSFQTESLRPLLSIGPYFSFLLWMTMVCGVVFDLPLILLGLIRLGVLRRKDLIAIRKFIVVGIFVVAAVITPPDPVSQLMVAGPLWILFEACILLGKWVEPKPARNT